MRAAFVLRKFRQKKPPKKDGFNDQLLVKGLSKSRLLSGSVVLVKNTLRASHIDLLDCGLDNGFLIVSVVSNSEISFLERGLEIRLNSLVSHSLSLVDSNSLLSRLDVWHLITLPL